ncbi:MAG TPA: hypothetical protein VHQ92_13500 [Pseudolabrys sp.]|jgi:hypothetical protein|nr:hypothetical protein [Pseudolabrys sp.]
MSNELTSEQAAFIVKECAKVFDGDKRTAEAFRMAESALRAQGEPVANEWHLDQESAKFLADLITGNDDPAEITLRLGFVKNDDGKVQYGLLVCESEYPEEGYSLLVECDLPTAPHPQGEAHGQG